MGGGRRRHPPGQLHHRRPLVRRRGDVEEDQLVRSLGVVVRRQLDGIADIAEGLELHALHDPIALHVEAHDHATGHHFTAPLVLNTVPESISASRSAMPSALNAASTM